MVPFEYQDTYNPPDPEALVEAWGGDHAQITIKTGSGSTIRTPNSQPPFLTVSVKKMETFDITLDLSSVQTLRQLYQQVIGGTNGALGGRPFVIFAVLANKNETFLQDEDVPRLLSDMAAADSNKLLVAMLSNVSHNRLVGQRKSKVPAAATAVLRGWGDVGHLGEGIDVDPNTPAAPTTIGAAFELIQNHDRANTTHRATVNDRGAEMDWLDVPPDGERRVMHETEERVERHRTEVEQLVPANMQFIPVYRDYVLLLSALNSVMFAVDQMLRPRGRTGLADPGIVREIMYEVLMRCAPEADRRGNFVAILNRIFDEQMGYGLLVSE